ncbi:MAG: SIMPL domain-containing protein [Xanthobacteraceae bacterium]
MSRAALFAAALISFLAASMPFALAQGEGRIRVIGRAVVEAVPDYVTVRVGVSNRGASPTAALDQNSAAARKIVDFAKASGIQERDIQTDAVNLSPLFKTVRDPNGTTRQEPDGYTASNVVRVKLSELPRLGAFMRQALEQGANNINGVQFGLSNYESALDDARTRAVEDAVRQAQRLADAAKVKLGKIQEILSPPRSQSGGDGPFVMTARRSAAPAAVPVEAGSLQINAEVEIVWAIE